VDKTMVQTPTCISH